MELVCVFILKVCLSETIMYGFRKLKGKISRAEYVKEKKKLQSKLKLLEAVSDANCKSRME